MTVTNKKAPAKKREPTPDLMIQGHQASLIIFLSYHFNREEIYFNKLSPKREVCADVGLPLPGEGRDGG
jgi:hypothetical protein